jgi:hypothetical protein
MLRVAAAFVVCAALTAGFMSSSSRAADEKQQSKDGWISLFDGKSLEGWKAAENPASFTVVDGAIQAAGPRAHLFYVGPVKDHNFKNFELKAKVMTFPKANAGLYFHTEYQEKDWPKKGYECQINATHSDWRKTGSLYAIKDVKDVAPHKDNEWFDYHIIVNGKNIVIKINDKETVNFTEPEGTSGGRKISSGTFAIQAHDPGSKVLVKDIMVKPLPD